MLAREDCECTVTSASQKIMVKKDVLIVGYVVVLSK